MECQYLAQTPLFSVHLVSLLRLTPLAYNSMVSFYMQESLFSCVATFSSCFCLIL